MSLDLSDASAAYLSFWVKHRAQNGSDKLQVQVSPSGPGVGSSFSSICGQHTIAENNNAPALTGIRENWTRETMDLSDYLGTTNLGLRFLFTSNNSKQDDGFYIDDIEIVKAPAVILNSKPGTRPFTDKINHTKPRADFQFYPNPVSGKLKLIFNVKQTTRLRVMINSISGIPIRSLTTVVIGQSTREIDFSSLANQVYFLQVINEDSGERSVYKILKRNL
jgi:hypothetical protein